MRTTIVPQQTVSEEIQSVEYNVNAYVRIVVGVGQLRDGVFEFIVPQQFQTYVIVDQTEIRDMETGAVIREGYSDFTDLNSEYPNGSWSTEDLWPYIDRIRNRVNLQA